MLHHPKHTLNAQLGHVRRQFEASPHINRVPRKPTNPEAHRLRTEVVSCCTNTRAYRTRGTCGLSTKQVLRKVQAAIHEVVSIRGRPQEYHVTNELSTALRGKKFPANSRMNGPSRIYPSDTALCRGFAGSPNVGGIRHEFR
jgi:hypothetical protein